MTESEKIIVDKWSSILDVDVSEAKKIRFYKLLENVSITNSSDLKFLFALSYKTIDCFPKLKISLKSKKNSNFLFSIEEESLYDESSINVEYSNFLINRIINILKEKNFDKIYSFKIEKEANILSIFVIN